MTTEFYKQQILLDPDIIHLNHAGVGPWLRSTRDAIHAFTLDNVRFGSLHMKHWEEVERELRSMCAQLLHADTPDDIAFLKNTSEGLSLVAYGYPWQTGDNVVFAQQEFPSNRIVWESLKTSHGVETRRVDLSSADSPEQSIIQAIDTHTRMIAVSAVQYADGLRMDLNSLARYCRPRNILLCVDAIQAMGAIPIDVQTLDIDIAVADAHKWLLAPEGIAIFYIGSHARNLIQPTQYGWHNIKFPNDFQSLHWDLHPSARRYECGSLNNLGIHALHASLKTIQDIGIERIYENLMHLREFIIRNLDTTRYEFISNLDTHRASGILTVRHRYKDNQELYRALIHKRILCAYRNDGIRLSPHFYTPVSAIENALEFMNQW